MNRSALQETQLAKLRRLVADLLARNAFYQTKLSAAGITRAPADLEGFGAFPFTTKRELAADRLEHPPYGSNLSFPFEHYSRFCQTSGTTGRPMAWLDTARSWSAMLDCWEAVYEAAGVAPQYDRVFFAFSFGPFLGFWTAYEAAARMGCLTIPGGGMSSTARLDCMETHAATVLCCTPTYAIRLGESIGDRFPNLEVRRIIVAGEPGGSLPEVRERISALWNGAEVFDHHGMTEVGPVSFPGPQGSDLLGILEDYYLAEIIDPDSGREVEPGERGELVLTTLERDGCPLLRYRTGDLVEKRWFDDAVRGRVLGLAGGILGRIDDMVVIRGVNLYPGAVERVVRSVPEIVEYRVRQFTRRSMQELEVDIEVEPGSAAHGEALRELVERRLADAFQLRIPVHVASEGALPRFEFKARRWVVEDEGPPIRQAGESDV